MVAEAAINLWLLRSLRAASVVALQLDRAQQHWWGGTSSITNNQLPPPELVAKASQEFLKGRWAIREKDQGVFLQEKVPAKQNTGVELDPALWQK